MKPTSSSGWAHSPMMLIFTALLAVYVVFGPALAGAATLVAGIAMPSATMATVANTPHNRFMDPTSIPPPVSGATGQAAPTAPGAHERTHSHNFEHQAF